MKIHKKLFKAFGALLVTALLFAAVPMNEVEAATLCVNPGGTDGCYASIQAAEGAASVGDIIVVADGTYDMTSEGATAGQQGLINIYTQVTIMAEEDGNGVRPVIDATGVDGVFKIHHSEFFGGQVVIEGFEITGDPSAGIAITSAMCDSADPAAVIIQDNVFHGMIGGIDAWGTGFCNIGEGEEPRVENLVISGNEFYDLGLDGVQEGFGILLEGLSDWTEAGSTFAAVVENNIFHDLQNNGANPSGGIVLEEPGAATPKPGNVLISGNVFNSGVGMNIAIFTSDVATTDISLNNFNNSGYDVYNTTAGVVDASPNWWGSVEGPGSGLILGDAETNPWCGESACSFLIHDVVPEGAETPGEALVRVLGSTAEGDEVQVPAGTYAVPGGFTLDVPGVQVFLADGVVIENESPCFTVTANNTKITAESLGGAVCTPTATSNGIDVNAGLTGVTIEGIEISGETGTHGIYFAGAVTDVIIRDMYIHDMAAGDGVHFTAEPGGYVEIKGNLFENNFGFGVNNAAGTTDIDATYNAWGDYAGPAGPSGDGVSTFVDADPWTHVDVFTGWVDASSRYEDELAYNDGKTITYEVKANLQNAIGAEFTLNFDPAYLQVVSVTNGSVFTLAENLVAVDYDNVAGTVTFNAAATSAQNGAGLVLYTVEFEDVAVTTAANALTFGGEEHFAMNPGMGSSLNIYASALTGTTDVNIYDLPTLSINPLATFAVGNAKEFTLTVTNPATGRAYTDLNVDLGVPAGAVLEYWNVGAWSAYVDGVDIGALEVDDTADVLFRITFADPGANLVSVDLNDGSIFLVTDDFSFTVLDSYTVTGSVQLQGRSVREGVILKLFNLDYPEYTYETTSVELISGNFEFTDVAYGNYRIEVVQDRYLDIVQTSAVTFLINGDLALERLELRGGDVDNSEKVDIADASIVGTNYGSTGSNAADANFDEKVNIFDLAMVGGNYNLQSDGVQAGTYAYLAWTPLGD